jgi:hypothetical protein
MPKKSIQGIGISILFILLGVYLLTRETGSIAISPMLVKGIGVACILFFGTILVIKLMRIMKARS